VAALEAQLKTAAPASTGQ